MRNKLKTTRLAAVLMALILLTSVLAGCGGSGNQGNDFSMPGNDALIFRPAETGVIPQASYEYPYMGLTATLTENLFAKMENLDAILLTSHSYGADGRFTYAILRWYALTEEQKNEEVESFDPEAWAAGLSKIGAIGAYDQESAQQIDALTGCTQHKELGRSQDGIYTYYMSLSDEAGAELKTELENTWVTITERQELSLETGNGVFSEARVDSANVGAFTTTDINGNEFTQAYFNSHDLTLVNVFTTWCTYCVEEMPDLEKLNQEMAASGVGVVGVVYDSVNISGEVQSEIIDLAKVLQQRAGVTFPLIIPDAGGMNGRLKGVMSYPESFFVDRNGNIISEPIVGARDFESWKAMVAQTLAQIQGAY